MERSHSFLSLRASRVSAALPKDNLSSRVHSAAGSGETGVIAIQNPPLSYLRQKSRLHHPVASRVRSRATQKALLDRSNSVTAYSRTQSAAPSPSPPDHSTDRQSGDGQPRRGVTVWTGKRTDERVQERCSEVTTQLPVLGELPHPDSRQGVERRLR